MAGIVVTCRQGYAVLTLLVSFDHLGEALLTEDMVALELLGVSVGVLTDAAVKLVF